MLWRNLNTENNYKKHFDMTYDQIIDEILSFAELQSRKNNSGEYNVQINSILKHFSNKYPGIEKRSIYEVIDEIEARGWLLERDSSILIFDPATFN